MPAAPAPAARAARSAACSGQRRGRRARAHRLTEPAHRVAEAVAPAPRRSRRRPRSRAAPRSDQHGVKYGLARGAAARLGVDRSRPDRPNGPTTRTPGDAASLSLVPRTCHAPVRPCARAAAAASPSGWLAATRERTHVDLRELTAVNFSNPRHGYRVRSPFTVEFAVKGMGVVPAGAAGGHRAITTCWSIRRCPQRDRQAALQMTVIAISAGPTFTVIDLPPESTGCACLPTRAPTLFRLQSRDHGSLPPASAETPEDRPAAFEASCAARYQDEVCVAARGGRVTSITNVRDGEPLVSPVSRFGVDGWGFALRPEGPTRPGISASNAARRQLSRRSPANGATQANLYVPSGNYQVRPALRRLARGASCSGPRSSNLAVSNQESSRSAARAAACRAPAARRRR